MQMVKNITMSNNSMTGKFTVCKTKIRRKVKLAYFGTRKVMAIEVPVVHEEHSQIHDHTTQFPLLAAMYLTEHQMDLRNP